MEMIIPTNSPNNLHHTYTTMKKRGGGKTSVQSKVDKALFNLAPKASAGWDDSHVPKAFRLIQRAASHKASTASASPSFGSSVHGIKGSLSLNKRTSKTQNQRLLKASTTTKRPTIITAAPSSQTRHNPVYSEFQKTTKRRAKCIAYQEGKKAKKLEKRASMHEDDEHDEGVNAGGRATVRFGDVVQAPPSLTVRPRDRAAERKESLMALKQKLSVDANVVSLTTTYTTATAAGNEEAKGKGMEKGSATTSNTSFNSKTLLQPKRSQKLRTLSAAERRQVENERALMIQHYRNLKQNRGSAASDGGMVR